MGPSPAVGIGAGVEAGAEAGASAAGLAVAEWVAGRLEERHLTMVDLCSDPMSLLPTPNCRRPTTLHPIGR